MTEIKSVEKTIEVRVFSAFIKVFMRCECYAEACTFYEQEMVPAGVKLDSNISGVLMTCAMNSGKTELAQSLIVTSPSDVAKHVAMIRARSKENDLEGAMAVFQKMQASGVQLNTLVYNSLLDACVQCGKLNTALQHFDEMKKLGLVDVVSFNTLLKAYLRTGQINKARSLVETMGEQGITANKVTYNEMLNALVSIRDRKGMWALITDMSQKGMHPNSVTCSIILKSLTGNSHPTDIKRAMDLVEESSDEMDEILFASMIEACVRIGHLDLLSSKLQQYASKGGFAALTAPTYGSMIKAYGKARDIERIRELWSEMRSRAVKPTSITLGCMVDALVNNQYPEEALELVHEIRADENCKDLLNTIVYSTLLKGFCRSKLPDRVQQVFEEMREEGISCNTVSYNTMINANVGSGRMDRADELFRTMKADGASPDEILFNSLLDGCAKQHRVDEALALLEKMHKHHVQPSNFTLSILVKLLGRSRRLNQAFSMVEETCQHFDFQANIHVYTCLIQACIQNRQLPRALKLHDSMIREAGVEPDGKTYAVLARGCVGAGSIEKAAAVVRAAYGLSPQGLVAPQQAPGMEPRALEEVMSALSSATAAEYLAVPLLSELRSMGVHVENNVYARATQTSMNRAGRNNYSPVQATFKASGARSRYAR